MSKKLTPWVDFKNLMDPKKVREMFLEADLNKTGVMPVANLPASTVPTVVPNRTNPVAPSAMPAAPAPTNPPPINRPMPASAAPPPTWGEVPAMTELPGDEPSLATRTRPDLTAPAQRHQDFSSAYNDPNAFSTSIRHKRGSLNATFHGVMKGGQQYIAKPHAGIGARDADWLSPITMDSLRNDAEHNANRHDATYEIMSAMGAHHMVVPGMSGKFHGAHQFDGRDPVEFEPHEQPATHAGQPAHIQDYAKDSETVHDTSPEDLDKIDAEHRTHGMVAHLLFGNQDGHSRNVMIHKSGHPILIDHDMTLGSDQADANADKNGIQSFKSAFAPGRVLDYQAKLPKDADGNMIPVGTNYSPRTLETLKRIRDGYYKKKLKLSEKDHSRLQRNAIDLLRHGLEGTLAKRYDMASGKPPPGHSGAESPARAPAAPQPIPDAPPGGQVGLPQDVSAINMRKPKK